MESMVSRRAFLGVTGVAASAALTPRLARASSDPTSALEDVECDVVVVGAGLAGLAAAHSLDAAGVSVVVVEAHDRVGGRVHDVHARGGLVPLGAVGIHAAHERVAALAGGTGVRLGAAQRPAANDLVEALADDRAVVVELRRTLARLDRLAGELDADAPWEAATARARDGRTLWSWIEDTVAARQARQALGRLARTVWGVDPTEASLLHVVSTAASAGGVERLVELALTPRPVAGGVGALAGRLAGGLGGRVRLASPVRTIEQTGDAVRVSADGAVVRARRAVVALPPSAASSIAWDPDLPAPRRQLGQRLSLAGTIAVGLVYGSTAARQHPGWIPEDGPFTVVRDVSRPGGPRTLVGQIVGDAAALWTDRSVHERREIALRSLEQRLGRWAARPAEYVEFDWQSDPYIGGGAGAPAPGALASLGPALRRPMGLVHWAGAEIAARWRGTLEGAVTSGEDAADEVLQALGRSPWRVALPV